MLLDERIKLCKKGFLPSRINEKIFSEGDFRLNIVEVLYVDEEHGYKVCRVASKLVDDMVCAYNLNDQLIGSEEEAEILCKKFNLRVEAPIGSDVCCIGYSPKEDGWCGWSHRAMSPIFKKGYRLPKDSFLCGMRVNWIPGYVTKDSAEAKEMALSYAEAVS